MTLSVRGLVLCCVCLLLASCSAVGILYGQADRILRWQADSYLDLSSPQDAWLKDQLRERMQWHRQTQLPLYIDLLADAIERLEDNSPVSETELIAAQQRVDALLETLASAMAPLGAELMQGLSDDQVEYFRNELNTRNTEQRDALKELSADEQLQKKVEELGGTYQSYFGTLAPEQQQRLEQAAQEFVDDDLEQIIYREVWQRDLLEALATRQIDNTAFMQRFIDMATHRDRWYTPEYVRVKDNNRAVHHRLIVDLVNQANDVQRQHLIGQLRDWAQTFEELHQSE